MRSHALVAVLAAGCAPGHIEWATGDDLIRTALYTTEEEDTATHVAVLLSNGVFECAINDGLDPAQNEDARGERCYSAYREDARHAVLHLWYPRGGDRAGVFPGDSDASPSAPIGETAARWSRASYLAIEEVVNNSGDDLVQDEFQVTRLEVWGAGAGLGDLGIFGDFHSELLGDGGTTTIDRAEDRKMRGTFSYPEARISGDFDADFCPWDAAEGTSIFRYFGIVDQDGRISEPWNLNLRTDEGGVQNPCD